MANCIIALEMSQEEVGPSPLMIMQNMIVIYETTFVSHPTFLIATVNTCGRFESIKISIY